MLPRRATQLVKLILTREMSLNSVTRDCDVGIMRELYLRSALYRYLIAILLQRNTVVWQRALRDFLPEHTHLISCIHTFLQERIRNYFIIFVNIFVAILGNVYNFFLTFYM